MNLDTGSAKVVLLIPAYNEAAAIGKVVREVRSLYPELRVIVCDDCSTDGTRSIAEAAGAEVVPLPCHLGLGGCIQTGYRLAYEMGMQAVVRIDGDGQHNPADIPNAPVVQTATEPITGVVFGPAVASPFCCARSSH